MRKYASFEVYRHVIKDCGLPGHDTRIHEKYIPHILVKK
jgi:hypothetical protein